MDQGAYDRFCLLHQWRERYAAIVDEAPNFVSNQAIITLAKLNGPFNLNSLREANFPREIIRQQSATLLLLLNGGGDLIQRINNCICHNCVLRGHAAVHCPFPPNRNRCREWAAQDPQYKSRQNRRRNLKKRENRHRRQLAEEEQNAN